MSKNTIRALTSDNTNPGAVRPKQGEPLAKILPIQPSNDPQTLLEEVYGGLGDSYSSEDSMDTTIRHASNDGEDNSSPQDKTNPSELESDPKIVILSNNKVAEPNPNEINDNSQTEIAKKPENTENPHKSLENFQIIKENIHKSLESLEGNEPTHPNLNRTASEDKSEEYMDADDNALSPPPPPIELRETNQNTDPSVGLPSQDTNKDNNTNIQNFQSEYVAEQNHPTKVTIKRLELPPGTQARPLNFGFGTDLTSNLYKNTNTGAIPKIRDVDKKKYGESSEAW